MSTVTVTESSSVAGLLSAPTLPLRVAHLRDEGLCDESGLTWVLDRTEELIHTDPAVAENLAELCDAAATTTAHASTRARARYLHARICAERGELARGLALIDQARAGWLAAGDTLQALRTDLGRMQILDDLGRHMESASVGTTLLGALDAFADDGADAEADGLRSTLRAAALGNIGVAYSFTGDHQRALAAYQQSENAYGELGMPMQVAQHRANRGIELLALGRAQAARDALRSAMDTMGAEGDLLWAAKCAGHLAEAHQQLGELVAALRVLEPAAATLAKLGASAEESRVHLAMARVYLAAGLYGEAVQAAETAATRMENAQLLHDSGFARLTLALAHTGTGDLDAAEGELRIALEQFTRVGDRQYQARARLARADLAARRGLLDAARSDLAVAVDELSDGGWQIPLTWARLRQADLSDQPDDADALLFGAAASIAELGVPDLCYAHAIRTARAQRRHGRSGESENLFRQAIEVAEQQGAGLPDPLLRTAFRADKAAAHDELVDLLVERSGDADLREACLVADRAKAQTLTDLLLASGAGGARRHAPADNGVRGRLARRRADLSATYAALVEAGQATHRQRLRKRALRLEGEVGALRLRAAISDGGCATDSTDGDVSQALVALPTAPALAYHLVGDDLIAFVVAAGRVRVQRMPGIRPEIAITLDRLVGQWNRFRMGADFARRHAETMHASTLLVLQTLYRLLVAPIRELLDELDTDGLVIVPHRLLHRVPFHALHDGEAFLIDRWAVTQSPTLPSRAAAPAASGTELVILAVPDANAPAIAAEVDTLRAVMPGARAIVGAAATTAELARQLPGPRYLHLACHGLYRAANPLFSALRLADRWLTSAEVVDLDLGGALVTLSACESGRPAENTAEPVGLAWAFLAAGASAAIVSQWVVDDEVTAELMSALYRHLRGGAAPARALQLAQQAAAVEHPHPYYWAPFVSVASPGHVQDGGLA